MDARGPKVARKAKRGPSRRGSTRVFTGCGAGLWRTDHLLVGGRRTSGETPLHGGLGPATGPIWLASPPDSSLLR